MSLSRQDVILGRALLAWGLVDQQRLVECANEVTRLLQQGYPATLGQLLVQQRLLSVDRYTAIVARLRSEYEQGTARMAADQVPGLSESGRYTKSVPRPQPVDESGVDRAVQNWREDSRVVTASGSDLGRVVSEAREDAPIRERLGVPAGQEQFPIGGWMVQGYLDAGNYGAVYRVTRQGADATPYALKVLKQLNPSEQIRQRFILEARTMRRLSHPGIVRFHDAGVQQGLLWFVMDFLEGPNLGQVFERQGALGVGEALRVVGSLSSAVAYAHGQSVLHRDLKPENVVMVRGREPILTDFGLAKDQTSTMNLTMEGQRIGTPLYMAPELLLDSSKANPLSEVYSLGALLYQCLTGRVPFEASGLLELVDLIEEGELTPLESLCPEAGSRLGGLCARALDKDPGVRPQSVSAFASELASSA